ncbi:hypothetical protein DES52_10872 [Deinococcus yavapaiensis KR-236]|uniref:Acetoacetate decarboxylase n=2 Tax=Deinococcus TaxID=1298 RepID=A0A318S4M3_9DEIO|nr:hypothetical protein DES52_10872 [Deinococcus yavapaiensis KR-236]
MMLVNYTSSPVGPYRELLFLGGFFESGGVVHPKVTRIVVDSEASARWGRRNWGLPKEVARFDWQGSDGQGGFVRVEQSGRLLGEFAWTEAGPSVPATTALIPARWGTLAQPCQERVLLTRPRGTGRVRFARLSHALVNPDLFPPLPTPLVSLRVTNFTMRFPPPTFRAGGRGDHTAV